MGETVAVLGAGVIGGAVVKRLFMNWAVDHMIATSKSYEKFRSLERLGVEIPSTRIKGAIPPLLRSSGPQGCEVHPK